MQEIQETAPATRGKSVLSNNRPQPVTKVPVEEHNRMSTGLSELDGVLGGGLVPGSLVLLGGAPGIGKSTLLLQAAQAVAAGGAGVLYCSGEESAAQVGMRAKRLGVTADRLLLLSETNLEHILAQARQCDIRLLVVDSIQSVYLPDLTPAPGSVSQVRQCGSLLLEYAKESGVTVLLVGHVTKEGALAGPRVLEHMVDAVLYFEGAHYDSFRLLRAAKNRFGSTNEIGIFEMAEQGLAPLADPSGVFLAQRTEGVAGSVVTCAMQGTRPVLLEVQALVAPTSFGNPRRLSAGVDYSRLLIIIAVLEKKLGLHLGSQDIYVNIAGGMKVDDPAADLGVALAIVSAYRDRPLEARLFAMGEVGLTGEIRHIGQTARRLKEGLKYGFEQAIVPKGSAQEKQMDTREAGTLAKAIFAAGLE